jgi:hypothetical protein
MKPYQRFFFWFLLSIFSTFFAEVTVGSAPLVFFKPDGWLLTVPVYGLHILVLAPLVIRVGRVPAWQSLYLAGMIFGLYEAYMTKILWLPTWNPGSFHLGGIAVAETLLLVFFWHPVMAFIVPLVFSERFLNLKLSILPGLGDRWTGWLSGSRFYLIAGTVGGITLGPLLADTALVLQVCVLNGIFMSALLFLWRRLSGSNRFTFAENLPSGKSWRLFLILLLIDFVALGILIRPEAIPPISSQLTIWVMYIIFAFFVYKARSHQPAEVEIVTISLDDVGQFNPLGHWAYFFIPFTIFCVLASAVMAPFKNIGFLAVTVIGISCGLFLFFKSLYWLFSGENQ